jgi:prepilin-type N-terminal cleavage/methylation domain-containing protein
MRRQGFTVVEVMVALGVMTISAMALFGMQAQATRANVRARDMTIASQIAQNVLERMKLDGLAWNTIGEPAEVLTNTAILNRIGTTPSDFMTLPESQETRLSSTVVWSNGFDLYGIDVPTSGPPASLVSIRFCASQRLAWVYDTRRAMRADVRVWWSKEAPTRSIIADFPGCADNDALLRPGGDRYDDYHTVYMSTVIRPHPR